MSGNEADNQDNPYTSSESPSGDESAVLPPKWTCYFCKEKENYHLTCIRRTCPGTADNSKIRDEDDVPGMAEDVASSDEEPRGFVRSPSEEEAARHWNADRTPDNSAGGPDSDDSSEDKDKEGENEGEGKGKGK